MRQRLSGFWRDTAGAVTVDWVVLTAAIVGLGVIAGASVHGGVRDIAGGISTKLTTMSTKLHE
ncbi:MAG: hypothetical protein WDA25_05570 [Paracoccaceae bacterium]